MNKPISICEFLKTLQLLFNPEEYVIGFLLYYKDGVYHASFTQQEKPTGETVVFIKIEKNKPLTSTDINQAVCDFCDKKIFTQIRITILP